MVDRAERTSPPLRILVVRSGGFAGVPRTWSVEAEDDADTWLPLIEACPWGAQGTDPAARDRFVWRIEVRARRHHRRSASVPDRDLAGPWRELVDRVKAAAESAPEAGSAPEGDDG
jgi:hypothetical protein